MSNTPYKGLGHLRGLITIPGTLALVIWLLSWPALTADRFFGDQLTARLPALEIDYEAALSLQSTIAAASITTLSLVYSIVLVVFTLAAGTIAPRLLKRFTGDRVNQITAGLLGGTFLFSLTVLHETDPQFVPALATMTALVLAAITVLQLIYFVHEVSRSVTIDEEIAAISTQLEHRLEQIVADNETTRTDDSIDEITDWIAIEVDRSGYLTDVDTNRLLRVMVHYDACVRITATPGTFLLEGQQIAEFARPERHGDADKIAGAILKTMSLGASRGSGSDIEYAVNVLIEIALRALSPGVNDTFTAIACVDRLSAAYRKVVARGLRLRRVFDDDGKCRVIVKGLSVEELIDTAIRPLRRASSDNLLMLQHLGDALERLDAVADDDVKPVLRRHAEMMLDDFKSSRPLEDDLTFLQQRLSWLTRSDRSTSR